MKSILHKMQRVALLGAVTLSFWLVSGFSAAQAAVPMPEPNPTPASNNPLDKMYEGDPNAKLEASAQDVGSALRIVAAVIGTVGLIWTFAAFSQGKKAFAFMRFAGSIWLLLFMINPKGTLEFTTGIFPFVK